MSGAPAHVAIRRQWERLGRNAVGRRLFDAMLGMLVPYSGTIRPRVVSLEPGRAVVRMHERRGVRNHLGSVHAAALLNLGELASGLAFNFALPADMRAILVALSMEYVKKARGTLTATCEAPLAAAGTTREYDVEARIVDEAGDVVATARARWLARPVDPAA